MTGRRAPALVLLQLYSITQALTAADPLRVPNVAAAPERLDAVVGATVPV